MCKNCKKIQEYFENELKIIESDKNRLINEVGEQIYGAMLATIKAYRNIVNKIVEAF